MHLLLSSHRTMREPTRTLPLLPRELILQIATYLVSWKDLNSLLRATRSLHLLLTPLLHTRAARAPFYRYGCSIIRLAAAQGNVSLLQRVIVHANGVDIDSLEKSTGTTALHAAIMLGRREAVTFLLAHGAAVELGDRSGWTALHWAALSGDCDIAAELLDHGAEPGRGTGPGGGSGTTPLHLAAGKRDTAMVALLVKRGASWEVKDQLGLRAVDFAPDYPVKLLGFAKGARPPEWGHPGKLRGLLKVMGGGDSGSLCSMGRNTVMFHKRMVARRWKQLVLAERTYAKLT